MSMRTMTFWASLTTLMMSKKMLMLPMKRLRRRKMLRQLLNPSNRPISKSPLTHKLLLTSKNNSRSRKRHTTPKSKSLRKTSSNGKTTRLRCSKSCRSRGRNWGKVMAIRRSLISCGMTTKVSRISTRKPLIWSKNRGRQLKMFKKKRRRWSSASRNWPN